MSKKIDTKKIADDSFLTQTDGNAFGLLGAFRKQAKREGWTPEEIEVVTKEATAGDYDHLVQTLIGHCS